MSVYTELNLRSGWEPAVEAGDSLLRAYCLNWAAFILEPARRMGARLVERDDVTAADLGRPGGFQNLALFTAPLWGARLDEILDELSELFGAPDATGMAGLFSPWPTPDLRPWGWTLGGHPPLMLRPVGTPAPPAPAHCEVRPVRGPGELQAFSDVLAEGFPLPGVREQGLAVYDQHAADDPALRLFLAWDGGRPVAAAAAYVAAGLNGVTQVATLPEARGRGFGEAVTWAATCAETSLPAALIASDLGRPVYERMGYQSLLRFTFWYRER